MSEYRFRWTCSYMNSASFDVIGDGQMYSIELRRGVCDYERSIFNGTEEEWQRDIVPLIGCIKRDSGSRDSGIKQEVVDAFNAWRMAEYLEHRASIDAQPEKYGIVDWDNDPVFPAPKPVRAVRAIYDVIPCKPYNRIKWHGWMYNGENTLAHLVVA
jgi:hypothetical protein